MQGMRSWNHMASRSACTLYGACKGDVHVTLIILSMSVYNADLLECVRIIKTNYNTCGGSGGWVCAHGRARFCFTASKVAMYAIRATENTCCGMTWM